MQRVVIAVLSLLLLAACSASSGGRPSSSAPPAASASPVASGSAVPTGAPPSAPSAPLTIRGTVTAGPVCPVERTPPDPSCAPRIVAGAVIVAVTPGRREVGRATTAADGSYVMTLAQTGTFVLNGLPVAGLMGVPKPVTVTVATPGKQVSADLMYDTGIR